MTPKKIGILHPGAMGVSVAAAVINSGYAAYWTSAGRSPETRARAGKINIHDSGSLENLVQNCNAILSVCPPHAAENMAKEVISLGFKGLYLDANAIAPQRAVRIGEMVTAAGASFVDGGIIGGPAWQPGITWLYLSGPQADEAAQFFAAGPLEVEGIGVEIGKASALKMCYAAYTKGTTALLSAILAASESLGVRGDLMRQWGRDDSGFGEQAELRTRRVTAKAWRFTGEMEEIASTFESAGLPGGFHQAASEIYRRLADFKDASQTPELDEVLQKLTND